MNFVRSLFSKLHHTKKNKDENGNTNIFSQLSHTNTPKETGYGSTDKCNLHYNNDLARKLNVEDADNVIDIELVEAMIQNERKAESENVLLDIRQSFDKVLLNDNNIGRVEIINEDESSFAAEKVYPDSVQNVDNVEFTNTVDNIGIEETTSNNEIDSTNDKQLLDLDNLKIISLKYEANELTELLNIEEPVNINNIIDSNDIIDFNDIDINTFNINITKVEKQEINEYDFGNILEDAIEDILTIINDAEKSEIDTNEIEKLCISELDSQKNAQLCNTNQSDLLKADSLIVTKDVFDNIIDTISISSSEDLSLHKCDNINVDDNIVDTISISSSEDLPLYKCDNIDVNMRSSGSTCILREDINTSITNQNTKNYEKDNAIIICDTKEDIVSDFNDDNSECSYHSSDFEFITENEAYNFKPPKQTSYNQRPLIANSFNYDMPGPSNFVPTSSSKDFPLYKCDNIDTDIRALSFTNILREDIKTSVTTQEPNNDEKYNTVIIHNVKENTISDFNDNSSDCSYHSSDFEFITEKEAYNFRPNFVPNETPYIQRPLRANTSNYDIPGPSNVVFDNSYRENHVIPEGNDYLNLFQGLYAPDVSNTYLFENKSLVAPFMNIEEISFDMRIWRENIEDNVSEDEYKEEANETWNKILEMYPEENKRKRMRRY